MPKISSIKPNPNNPRIIRDAKFKKLVANVKDYPGIMALRPIVIESWDNPVILGGNMRYKALIELGYTELPAEWVKTADELTTSEREAFVILDNVGFGEWEEDMLTAEWDTADLKAWGVDLPEFKEEKEQEDKNDELDNFIVKYEIVFNNEGEQDKFYRWLKKLKENYQDFDTVSERIIAYLEQSEQI